MTAALTYYSMNTQEKTVLFYGAIWDIVSILARIPAKRITGYGIIYGYTRKPYDTGIEIPQHMLMD